MVSYILLCSSYINVEHIAGIQIFWHIAIQIVILEDYVDDEYSLLLSSSLLCVVVLPVLGSSVAVKGSY